MIPISDTEEFIEASIKEEEQWHKQYDSLLSSLINSINSFLKTNTTNSLYTLCTFLTNPEIINTFKGMPEIAHCLIAANIASKELNNNITTLYLTNTLNIDGIIKKNTYYKFLLLNIEFDVDKTNALKIIANDIYSNTLSSIALERLIKITSLNIDYVSDCISDYIKKYEIDNNNNNNYSNNFKRSNITIIDYNKTTVEPSYNNISINNRLQPEYNDKQFCFIICSNNEQYEKECIKYINSINIPNGYTTDIIVIHNASSMTAGYNKAMKSSNAKYKIYLHQDVFILNKNILFDILKQFKDKHIGMIGMVGSKKLPRTCVMWFGWRIGHFISNNIYHTTDSVLEDIKYPTRVEAIDGFMMITQYDISWRDDILTGWDFYDISQSFEFRKSGYDVIIPPVKHSWCFHDDGIINLSTYYTTRKIFMNEYADML